jgi:two-component system LytT family sensor kinase
VDRRQVFLITVGLWLATMAAFASIAGIFGNRGLPLWMWIYLAGVPVSGVLLSLVLQAGIVRFERLSLASRWLRMTPIVLMIVLFQAVVDQLYYELVRAAFNEAPTGEFGRAIALNTSIYIWVFAIQSLIFELIAALDRAARNARRAEEAREAARTARMEALNNELNPHMLFNTLNGLSSLVLSGRNADAETLLERLSVYIRACLESTDTGLIPLAQEIELIQAYAAIEAVRFARTPDIRIQCPEDLADAAVPQLILQPLVENALKYAVHPSRGSAFVTVSATREAGQLRLTVQDTGTDAPPVSAGTGRGLSIVRRRLETLFGADTAMEAGPGAGGFRVDLLMPLTTAAA